MQEVSTTTVSFPSTSSQDAAHRGASQRRSAAVGRRRSKRKSHEWIESHAHVTDAAGRRQVVRNGYLPKRSILTGIGSVEVEQPRVLDRRGDEGEVFSSKILPPYLRKTRSLEELIPWLYLKGVSTGDFSEALSALVGPERQRAQRLDDHAAQGRSGRKSSRSGRSDPSTGSSTSTCGPTASTSTSAWKRTASASWS